MFGLGFGEMIVLGIVLLVVIGPRELPKLLRAVGKGIRKLREMSYDLREKSGLDDIIQDENLHHDLDAIRSLSRGKVVNSLVRDITRPRPPKAAIPQLPEADADAPIEEEALQPPEGTPPDREQEYPEIGCDAYDAKTNDAASLIQGLHHPADLADLEAQP